jgi:hypothetical protein
MSDTGLYLNWNPTWPRERLGAGGHSGAWGVGGIGGGVANTSMEKEMMMDRWEKQYEQGLKVYENFEHGSHSCAFFLISWHWYCDER